MKASFYTESILYWLARGASFAAQRMPATWSTALGAWGGSVCYHLLGSRRGVALSNLRAAFGQTKTEPEYRRILKGLFQNLGMTLMEIARIPSMDEKYIRRWISVAPGGRERLEAARAQGRGVIFLAAHFGNWEMVSITGALQGYPTLVLARQQGWPRLNRLLTRYRESKGCRVVTKGFPIRELVRGLEAGKIVGILADQDGGRNGILAPFFGRLVSTAPGAVALSIHTGAPILPVFIIRTGGPAHTLVVEEPLAVAEGAELEARIRGGIAAYLQLLERYVRRYPSQWLWLHRRWKSSPQRRLLLLSDGKAGHEAQLKGLAERIQAAWEEKSRQDRRLKGMALPALVEVQMVQVICRTRLRRFVLSLVATLLPRRTAWAAGWWLRWGLTPESHAALRSTFAQISVSCGASTAAAHLLWAGEIRSKTIHITRVRFPSWRRFDLAVIPRHDFKKVTVTGSDSHLLLTDGALASAVRTDSVRQNGWRKRLGLKAPLQIGLLVGGAARGVAITSRQMERVVRALLEVCDASDAELLVTSSRRTPPELERQLAGALQGHPRCRLLVLVNQGEPGGLGTTQEAVDCMLALASVCVVSGDSISMVSEALHRGKEVVSFYPEKIGFFSRYPKYWRFLDQLKAQERIRVADPQHIGRVVEQVLRHEGGLPRNDEKGKPDPIVEFLKGWL